MLRNFTTVCENPDCMLDETFVDDRDRPFPELGGAVVCDCGSPAIRIASAPPTIGIITEYVDVQAGRVFNTNAEYKDYLRQGTPILNDEGEIIGTKEIREYTHDEINRQQLAIRESQERSAQRSGMAWCDWKAATCGGKTAEQWKGHARA